MKPFLLLILLGVFAQSALAQTLPSKVYSWNKAPVVKYTGYEDRTLVEGTTRDFNDFSVHGITLFADQPELPTQIVDDEILVIVKEGELTVTLGEKTKTLGPGSVVLVMPGDAHRFANKSRKSVTYFVMRYTSKEVPDLDLTQLAGQSFWVDWKEVPYKPHDKGGIRRIFDQATVMCKRFEMHVTTLNPGLWSHPPHTHRAAEILLLIENTAQESIDGVLHPAEVGDIIFLEANVPHGIQNTGSKPCTYFAFQFE
ncbi:(S)-ureidoglycine aminohydrolase [Larkinella arboricola]|uniref:(S)-ureidoglycine aminohydrolase n=1 Tax=Larkinella arboricola TaxID=643671 RepID=A0A327X3B2_LARAB|nr:cupin domain-containing protein [Larkinella arboricola]RAK00169.1 (S)-ureidoglycine aminohydrolase [Larkinella arboricola]